MSISNIRRGIVALLAILGIGLGWDVNAVPKKETTAIPDTLGRTVNLSEVTVKPQKEQYTKKNNAAVSIIDLLRKSADQGSPYSQDYYTCEKYDNMLLAIDDVSDSTGIKDPLLRKIDMLKEYVDTSKITGKTILPLSVKERVTKLFYRRKPESRKELVVGIKRKGVDQISDEDNIQVVLDDLFRDINLYDNDINLLNSRMVSPLSKIGPDFYKYYLTDTIVSERDSIVEITFAPHNNAMAGFAGRIYVSVADTVKPFIEHVSMILPHNANVNFVKGMQIEQTFERDSLGNRLKSDEMLTCTVQLFPGTPGLYVEKHSRYYDHSYAEPDNTEIFSRLGTTYYKADAYLHDDNYWDERRGHHLMAETHQQVTDFMTALRNNPMFYTMARVIKVLVTGYIPIDKHEKFLYGPVNTSLSFNDVEGARLRAGGMTTANLNRHWFGKGYVAYGTKDHEWKYEVEAEYSFNEKKKHAREFPVHSLKIGYKYDIDQIGQRYTFTNPDNIFLSLKRMPDTLVVYKRNLSLDYTLELDNHFSTVVSINKSQLKSSKYLPFNYADGTTVPHLNFTGVTVTLRYAPGERFIQTRSHRESVNNDAPIIMLTHTYCPAHFAGGSKYTVNKTEIDFQKRFWFSAWGCADVLLKGGHVWSTSPFTELLMPNANLSYTIQPESFALLTPMEFVTDSYMSLETTYQDNGALMNYVPVLKRLKLREVVSFKGYWGRLSHKNNPERNQWLPMMPAGVNPRPMDHTPYMEMSVGLDNILKVMRIDYVWRLSYRHTPGADRRGIRVALHFSF